MVNLEKKKKIEPKLRESKRYSIIKKCMYNTWNALFFFNDYVLGGNQIKEFTVGQNCGFQHLSIFLPQNLIAISTWYLNNNQSSF